MSNIPINSGTGPGVAVDLIGTDNYQVVKIMQAGSGSTASLSAVLAVTGTMAVSNTVTITGTVGSLMLQRLDNTNDSILIYGVQTGAGVNVPLALSTTGGIFIASGGGGGAQYAVSATNMGATATGTVILGMQSGSTAAQSIAVTTTGAQYVLFLATQTVNASLLATTAIVGAFVGTAHASRFNAYAVATTSAGAGIIVKTSGANTLYITDVLISVPTPMNVGLYSETTGPLAFAYLAANGGFAMNLIQPLVCTTAQSLRVILSSSGSCSVTVCGFTVT